MPATTGPHHSLPDAASTRQSERRPVAAWNCGTASLSSGTSWLVISSGGACQLRLRGMHETAMFARNLDRCIAALNERTAATITSDHYALLIDDDGQVRLRTAHGSTELGTFAMLDLRRWLAYCAGDTTVTDDWDSLPLLRWDLEAGRIGAMEATVSFGGRQRDELLALLRAAAGGLVEPGRSRQKISDEGEQELALSSDSYGRFAMTLEHGPASTRGLYLTASSLGFMLLHPVREDGPDGAARSCHEPERGEHRC